MGLNTNGNAPHKFKGIHLGKAIDRGLYYGLQFSKNRESKRYHSFLYDIALRQLQDNSDERDFKRRQGDLQHAENLLRIQAQNNANQGEMNLKQKEQLMKLYQYAKRNGLDTSQLEDALKKGADVDMSKMNNTKEWNEAFGTWKANNKEGGGATPNNSPPESNHTVGDNTNPQPDNPNDNKEPFNEQDTPDNPINETSPSPNQPDLETKENNPLYNWWNKHFSKGKDTDAHSKQYYKDATNELSGKNADLQSNLDTTNQSLANEQQARQQAETELGYAKKDADINFKQNLDATKYGMGQEEKANQLAEDVANKQKEADYQKNMADVNKSGMEDATNQAQKEAQEKRDIQSQLDSSNLQNQSKDAKIDELNKQAEQTKEDSQRAWDNNRQFVKQLTDERTNLSNENKSLKSDKENLTNENQSLKTDNENVNKQLQDKDQYIKDHDAYMFNREQKHDKQNAKDLEIAKSETARAQADKASQKAKYEKQIGGLNDENSKLRNSNDSLKAQSDKYKSDSEIKDRLLGNQNKNNVSLERNNADLKTKNDVANKEIADKNKTIANNKVQMDKQTKQYAKDIQASKGETSRAQGKLADVNEKLRRSRQLNKNYEHKLGTFISKVMRTGTNKNKGGGGNNGSNSNQ